MTDDHELKFEPFARLADKLGLVSPLKDQPPAWGAGVYPWTFVITEPSPGRFAASANDSRSPVPARTDIGTNFPTMEAAQEACRDWLRSRRP